MYDNVCEDLLIVVIIELDLLVPIITEIDEADEVEYEGMLDLRVDHSVVLAEIVNTFIDDLENLFASEELFAVFDDDDIDEVLYIILHHLIMYVDRTLF